VSVVVESLEETFSKVHITNRINGISESHSSWELPIPMAPMMLDTFHVPLVDHCYDLFAFTVVDVVEEVFISLVDEDFLHSWEKDVQALDIPVNKVLIQAFLCESLRACLSNLLSVTTSFSYIRRLMILESLHHVVNHVHSGLMIESIVCYRVDF